MGGSSSQKDWSGASPVSDGLESSISDAKLGDPAVDAIDELTCITPSTSETAYLWDMVSDTIRWEANAKQVLGLRNMLDLSTGRGFQFLVVAEHVARRQGAFEGHADADDIRGMPYRVTYRFLPGGRRTNTSLWVEERGRWWPDADGNPARARGVIRVLGQNDIAGLGRHGFSDFDELTGQLNRMRLIEAMQTAITRSQATNTSCAVLMLAVNNLSDINNTFGYAIGDQVLTEVSAIVAKLLRGGDTIGRYSSNKFGIVLNDCGPSAMRIAAERFISAVRKAAIRPVGCPISAAISIGGIQVPRQAETVEKALSRSLEALERGRTRAHDGFNAYEPNAQQESVRARNRAIADEVVSALDEDRMRLLLQPIVDSKTHEPAFYECLLRLERKDGTLAGAAEFIPVAEQLGMSRLIDRRTLELTIKLLKLRPDITVSLNVSSLTCSDHEWLVTLHRLTRGKASFTKRLIVEITETMAIHDLDQTIAFVDSLRELGCRVAIDDFGAGYTSFKNLKHLQVDLVKIDGSFANNLAEDTVDRIFLKSLSELAASFGMETVAEWVGDELSAAIIADMGITYMQGFHFGRPMEIAEIPAVRSKAS
ncbi:MAG: hypothetical protein RLZ98_3432 [Pseudomonadota bacterium]